MAKHTWDVTVGGEAHVVEYSISWVTAAGDITLDGEVIDEWGLSANVTEKEFPIGPGSAVIIWRGRIARKPELVVDGAVVPMR
ncbi:MAG: hypothetical protein IIC94_06230 [Chloroflexi bacterium]|nr:hypothetical protein [Chloroflexota bacterium]